MGQTIHQQLIDFGLSEKEARVYAALLELGPTTVQEIASHSGVNRTTTYLAVESLKEHGLVSSYEEDKRSMLVAESPTRLADLIDDEVRIAQEKQRIASSFIPELLAIYKSQRVKPVVRFYEGEEGLKTFRAALAQVRSKSCDTFARLSKGLHEVARTDEQDRLDTVNARSRYRIIYVPDEGVPVPRFPQEIADRIEIRYASQVPYEFDGEVGILDSVTYMASMKPRVHICMIESEQIARLMRAEFELVWTRARAGREGASRPS